MSTPSPQVLHMARQGHPDAIATLMNRHLEPKGITAHVAHQDGVLQVVLEAALVPSQAELVPYVTKGITGLKLTHIQRMSISGKQQSDYNSAWSQEVVFPEGAAQQEPVPLAGPSQEASSGPPSTTGEDIGADLDALLTADNYNLDRDLNSDLGDVQANLDLILDQQNYPTATSEDLLDFDLGVFDSPNQPEDLDFDQLLSATPASEPQDLTLDFLLEDSALSPQVDLPDDPTLSQGMASDTDLESSGDDLNFELDWLDQTAEPPGSPPTGSWQEEGPDLGSVEEAVSDRGIDAHLDLSTLFSDQPQEQQADLPDSISSLDPDINLWTDSVDLDVDLETQPLAAEFQDLEATTFDPNLVFSSPTEPVNSFGLDSNGDDSPDVVSASQAEPWSNPGESATQIYDWPIEAEAVQNFEADTLNIDSDFSYGLVGEGSISPPEPGESLVDFDQTEELQEGPDLADLPFPDSEAEFVRLRDQSLPDLEDFDSISMDVGADVDLDLEDDGLDLPSIDFTSGSPYYRTTPSSASLQTNGFLYEASDHEGHDSDLVSPEAEVAAADDFIHTFAPVADRDVDQLSSSTGSLRGWPKILAGLGFGILALILATMGLNTLRTLRTSPPAPVVLPEAGTSPAEPIQPESGDIFRDAVNTAMAAADLTQTAKTGADWQVVADTWSQAIDLMQQVPNSHPRYAVAQAKAVEYQTNLAYAQENVRRFP